MLIGETQDDGVYLDAFADAKGRDQVGGQFFGLPIVTQSVLRSLVTGDCRLTHRSSITKEHLVLRADDQQIDYRMIHEFHFSKAFLLGQTVTFSTLVSLELQDGKIKKLSDRPEGDLPSDTVTKAMRECALAFAPRVE